MIYSPGPDAPADATRINGVVYSGFPSPRTAHVWGYPTSRPSARFDRFNAAAQQADQVFAALSPAEVEAWGVFAYSFPDWSLCDLWDAMRSGVFPASSAVQAHRAVSLACVSQSLPPPTLPPNPTIFPGGDTVTATGPAPYTLVWNRMFDPVSVAISAQVYARSVKGIDYTIPSRSKFRFLASLMMFQGVAVDITAQVVASGLGGGGPFIQLEVDLMEVGLSPFAAVATVLQV